MNIVRYRPFGELNTIQNEMNRLFASFTPDAFGREEAASGAWNPKVNIFENKDGLVLEAELPGVKQEDFDLTVEDNVITLKGERKFEKETSDDNYHRVERSYGSFARSFTLPANVAADGSEADFSNGVLRVTLPKREETKARKIEIKGGDASKTIETGVGAKTANA
ncbi:MAG: Hsp20/alpha crystallin family protein [Acidobacteriota bacterium]